ncbi:hypothetical protein [Streptomyces sp. NPDC047868]|uniref:hypothetical protein n=1 Tax=Streptomyces sp. NPDC047868 TaxID=3155480 RepID=UPI003451970D
MDLHTDGNAVPALDGTDLGDLLDDLYGIDEGIDLMLDGARHIALKRLTVDKTQTLAVTLAGSPDGTDVLTAIGLLTARILNADSNPALRTLDLTAQKKTQLHGELLVHHLADHELHQHASNASGSIHTD